jgi:hypothetical protein
MLICGMRKRVSDYVAEERDTDNSGENGQLIIQEKTDP